MTPKVKPRAAARESAGRRERSETVTASLGGLSPVVVVIVLLVFFSLTAANFFTVGNLVNILKQMAIVGVLGAGMTLVVLIGGIDLSVGSVLLLSGAITGTLVYNYAISPPVAILAGLLAGLAVGFLNGLLIERALISPVIVTLSMMIAVRGLGQAILWINNSWVWVTDPAFIYIAEGRILTLPVIALIMLAIYLLLSLMLTRTSPGRYIYAIGGNERAALLNGLPVLRTKIGVYMLCGLTAAIAGILTASRIGVVGPSVGTGMEFDAITAVVLGGTRLSGGIGRVERTLLGTAMLVMVLNYLTIRGVPDVWQTSVTGFLILGAVLVDRLARRGIEAR